METKKPSTEEDSNSLVLDKIEILANIGVDKMYTTGDGVTIRKWEGEENTDLFIADINKNNIKFLGVLNSKLQKDNYGVLTYPNGEKYFGLFQKELRTKQGFYEYSPKIIGDKILREYYFGLWRDNQKDDHGSYLWLTENKDSTPFSNFDNADFDCYTGEIDMETFSKGTYLSKKGGDYYLYHGYFNTSGEKHGEDCFYYNATKDELMLGTVRHDKFIRGFIAMFDEDGKLKHIMKCEFDEEGKVSSFQQKEEIESDVLGKVCNDMEMFRNVILGVDYFGKIFEVFQKTKEYVDKKMNNLEVFDSSDEFPKMMAVSFLFNEIKIFQNIEKNIKI